MTVKFETGLEQSCYYNWMALLFIGCF